MQVRENIARWINIRSEHKATNDLNDNAICFYFCNVFILHLHSKLRHKSSTNRTYLVSLSNDLLVLNQYSPIYEHYYQQLFRQTLWNLWLFIVNQDWHWYGMILGAYVYDSDNLSFICLWHMATVISYYIFTISITQVSCERTHNL